MRTTRRGFFATMAGAITAAIGGGTWEKPRDRSGGYILEVRRIGGGGSGGPDLMRSSTSACGGLCIAPLGKPEGVV